MKAFVFLSALFLVACAGKPVNLKTPEPAVRRGWTYIEPEQEILGLETGVSPVSYSGPLLVGEKLVFGSDRFGLSALSRRTGQLLWQKRFLSGVAVVPLSWEGKVFVGTESGELAQLELDSGRELWSISLSAPVQGSMALVAGRLFVSTIDEAVHGVDPSTGKVLWTYRRPAFAGTSVRGGGHPSIIGNRIWMGFSDGALVSLNPETGAVESEKLYRDNLKFMDLDAKIIGWRDGLLVASYDGKLRYLRPDGTLLWEFPAGGARAPILTEGDTIYLPSSDGTVYALSGQTGKEIWRYSFRRGVPTGMALVQGGKWLAVAASEEKMVVLNGADGKVLGQSSFGPGSGSYSPIAVDKETNSFFVLSNYSRVYQFKLARP